MKVKVKVKVYMKLKGKVKDWIVQCVSAISGTWYQSDGLRGSSYFLSDDKHTHEVSVDACSRLGGQLVSINDLEEFQFIHRDEIRPR